MSALIKKVAQDKEVYKACSNIALARRSMRVIDRPATMGFNSSNIDFLVETHSEHGAARSALFTMTHVQDLDDLILALTKLRETYQ